MRTHRRGLCLLAVVAVGVGCKGKQGEQQTQGQPSAADAAAGEVAPDAAPAPGRPNLAVLVRADAVWVGGPGGVHRVAHCGGAPDAAAMVEALCAVAEGSSGAVDVSAGADVRHAMVIAVLDGLKLAGVPDLALVPPQELAVPLPGDPARASDAPPRCEASAARCDALMRAADEGSVAERDFAHVTLPRAAAAAAEVQSVLVVTVAKEAIYLAGMKVADLAEVRKLPAGQPIPALVEALRTHRGGSDDAGVPLAIAITADKATPHELLIRVLDSCTAAGIRELSFALIPEAPLPEPPPLEPGR